MGKGVTTRREKKKKKYPEEVPVYSSKYCAHEVSLPTYVTPLHSEIAVGGVAVTHGWAGPDKCPGLNMDAAEQTDRKQRGSPPGQCQEHGRLTATPPAKRKWPQRLLLLLLSTPSNTRTFYNPRTLWH